MQKLTVAACILAILAGNASAKAEITPLNCGPAGPSAAANTTPVLNTQGVNTLIEPAATAQNPRVYLEIQLISGNPGTGQYAPIRFTLDGTDAAASLSGEFALVQPGDRMRWTANTGAGGLVIYQGPIYAAAASQYGAAFTCKVYPQ